MPPDADADAVIRALGLVAHPEGGWFAETWRSPAPDGGRGHASAIHFLLAAGERSHWHRVDADEVWMFHAGDELELRVAGDDGVVQAHRLGPDVRARQHPQVVVPAGAWQSAEPLGRWTLVGCVVAPAFTYEGFELAPPGWEP